MSVPFTEKESLATILTHVPATVILYCKIQNHDVPIFCPVCNSEMKVRGSKKRYIKTGGGDKLLFKLRQLFCPICKKIHLEIPDLMQPYRQYEKATIVAVQSGDIASFAGDNSTVRYWQGRK